MIATATPIGHRIEAFDTATGQIVGAWVCTESGLSWGHQGKYRWENGHVSETARVPTSPAPA